jgi:hypothetical protein
MVYLPRLLNGNITDFVLIIFYKSLPVLCIELSGNSLQSKLISVYT